MEKEKFFAFDGDVETGVSEYLDFDGDADSNEFDEFVGKKAKERRGSTTKTSRKANPNSKAGGLFGKQGKKRSVLDIYRELRSQGYPKGDDTMAQAKSIYDQENTNVRLKKKLSFDGDVESGEFDEFSNANGRLRKLIKNVGNKVNEVKGNVANKIQDKVQDARYKAEMIALRTFAKNELRKQGKGLQERDRMVDAMTYEQLIDFKRKAKSGASGNSGDSDVVFEQISMPIGRGALENALNIAAIKSPAPLKSTTAEPLPAEPLEQTEISTAAPSGTEQESDSDDKKPNYLVWGGIALAVLTLGFLAYRKFATKK